MRRILCLWFLCLCVWPALGAAQQTVLPLKSGSVRFVVIGDMGTGGKPQYDIAAQMAELHKTFPFDFVIMVGDNIYGGKSPRDFAKKFEDPYKPLLDEGVKFYASLGNHDVPAEELYKPFNMGGHRYYAFDKGNVRFYALDSNYMDPDQLKWLGDDLRSSGAAWKIPFFHHPLYSSGGFHGSSIELRHILEPVFVETGVRVVFSGHDHIYERTKPQKGIYYFVEGSGGQLRKGDLRPAAFEAAGFDQDRTFMAVEIVGDDMFFETIARTGKTVDSGEIHLKD
ncbi:MAG: metallophosphoesterase family protein [Candidatus Acidiferrales bacterium]